MRDMRAIQPLGNERGIALILAIGMVAVISILASIVYTSTNRELKSSGRFQNKFAAFYTADRAVEYSLNRDILLSLTPGDSTDLMADTIDGSTDEAKKHYNFIEIDSGDLESGMVTDEGPGSLPAHLAGKYGSEFGANLYHVSTRAKGPDGSEAHVDSQIVRLFKLDDDTIFRTSGDE